MWLGLGPDRRVDCGLSGTAVLKADLVEAELAKLDSIRERKVAENEEGWRTRKGENRERGTRVAGLHVECSSAQKVESRQQIIRNSVRKLSLPNGHYPPRITPRKNLRERIDNYQDSYQEYHPPSPRDGWNHDFASSHYLEIMDDYSSDSNTPTISEEDSKKSWVFQALINVLTEDLRRLKQSRRLKISMQPSTPYYPRNSVPTDSPLSWTHNSDTCSPSPWTPLTPPKSATFKLPDENHSVENLPYSPQRPRGPMIPITVPCPSHWGQGPKYPLGTL